MSRAGQLNMVDSRGRTSSYFRWWTLSHVEVLLWKSDQGKRFDVLVNGKEATDNVRCIDTLIELIDARLLLFYSPCSTQSIIGVETGCSPAGLVQCSKIIRQ